ncbi:MAG: PEP-CTERM sorting domain-containing protein [Candidatus Hydrogenedentes bacterium]|nr:PEP-CTERM sorting domain-containing protein [Candidatus Hydrogenedentota bacterium]
MHSRLRIPILCISVMLTLSPGIVWADLIIYDNGAPDLSTAFLSDLDPNNVYGQIIEEATDFVLAEDFLLTDVHWWGVYWPDAELPIDDFTISLFAAGAGGPGTLIESIDAGAVSRTDTSLDIQGLSLFSYSFVLATPVSLSGNTTYYMSIANNTVNSSEGWFWAVSSYLSGDTSWSRYGLDGEWGLDEGEAAFYLTGSREVVPEPATISLLGIGLASLAAARARRGNH